MTKSRPGRSSESPETSRSGRCILQWSMRTSTLPPTRYILALELRNQWFRPLTGAHRSSSQLESCALRSSTGLGKPWLLVVAPWKLTSHQASIHELWRLWYGCRSRVNRKSSRFFNFDRLITTPFRSTPSTPLAACITRMASSRSGGQKRRARASTRDKSVSRSSTPNTRSMTGKAERYMLMYVYIPFLPPDDY